MTRLKSNEALRPPRKTGVITSWLLRHLKTSATALGRICSHPFGSLMTVLVIGVTLALPTSMHLIIKNARSVSTSWDSALDFSVYLKGSVTETEGRRLAAIIGKRADIESVIFLSADEALLEFREKSGFGLSLDSLPTNPLPHTLIIRPASTNTEVSIGLLNEEIGNLPEIDFVQLDTEWVRRFHAILSILEQAIFLGTLFLGAAILVIIGNTIRLDIQNRHEEIEVTKLIGASNAFIRRPFLYSGFWYGLMGGLLTLILVWYGLYALEVPIATLTGLYQSNFVTNALDFRETLVIIGTGVGLGLIGSWTAATRHLRQIEPR